MNVSSIASPAAWSAADLQADHRWIFVLDDRARRAFEARQASNLGMRVVTRSADASPTQPLKLNAKDAKETS